MPKSFCHFLFFLMMIVHQPIQSQDIDLGRIAHYDFSGNAEDSEGSNDGSVTGATSTEDRFGVQNRAFSFDGVNNFIEIPHNSLINFDADEDFSISLWVNPNENQNDLNGTNVDILGKWNTLIPTPYPYAIRYFNNTATPKIENG